MRTGGAPGNVHQLRSSPEFFEAILCGDKRHELRRTDRPFKVGDILELHEHDPATRVLTGRKLRVRITFVTSVDNPCALSSEALASNFCILSIAPEDAV
jgi:hypothetical protein